MAIASTRHPYEQLSRSASGIGSTPWWSMAAALVFSAWAHNTHAVVLHTHIGAPHCADAPTAPAALAHIAQDLQVQGLALDACCEARSGGWIVRVRVMDGMKARQTVRGPLQTEKMSTWAHHPAWFWRARRVVRTVLHPTCSTIASG